MVQLYTDGGSRGNPGPAAYAFLIYDKDKKLYSAGKKLGTTTNNVAEYTAVVEGLRKAIEFGDTVDVFSDSELVVKQIKGEYKVKQAHLKELNYELKALEKNFRKVTYTHRPREDAMQQLADELVNKVLDA